MVQVYIPDPILHLFNTFLKPLLKTIIFRINILIAEKLIVRVLNSVHQNFQTQYPLNN